MIIEIDDAWAESELEKQLRSLTPIDDLEEAENKLSLLKSYIREDDSNFENPDKFQSVTEDLLPASAELFFSLIQHTSNAVEQELLECQSLVDKQVEQYTIKTESEENEDDWEEEFILTNDTDLIEESSQIDDDSTRSDQKADEQKFKSYQLRVQSDLPIYQVSQVPVSSQVNTEEINMAEVEAERERKEKEMERNRKMEAERLRLEALQKIELQKIEEEMRLAEEVLQKELLEHELKIKKMNERLILEKKLHAEEMKKQEEENLRKRELSAVKIQAHFRGMRTRKLHKEELDKRIALKKQELMDEQLKYYEELIRKEREAVEAELKQRREEEEERKREELRAEEIRKRHMEKMRKKEEEEERLRLESEKREKAKKDEEEERSRLMSAQVLHWLQENENGQRSSETEAVLKEESKQNQNKTKDSSKDFDKNVTGTVAVDDNRVEQPVDIDLANLSQSRENHSIDSDINENSVQRNNLNNNQGDDNFNANQTFVLDNKVLSIVPENDNESKKSKSSFLGNIASKAKNFLMSSSTSTNFMKTKNEEKEENCNQSARSPELQKAPNTDMQLSLRSSNLKESLEKPTTDSRLEQDNIKASDAPVPEKEPPSNHLQHAEQKSKTFEETVPKSEIKTNTEKRSSPQKNSQIHSEQSKDVCMDDKEPLVQQEVQSVIPEFQNTTTVSLEPQREGHSVISKRLDNVQYQTNPLSCSLDMSLTPHPPLPKVAVSLDLSHKQSPITPPSKPRASPQAAKAEYRRKRKLREDVTLARQISDVSRSTSPSKYYKTKQVLQLDWSIFVEEFETNFKNWRDLNLPWSEHPRPPSTANSSRQTHNSLPHLEPRIVNNSCLVENYVDCALTNPSCAEVYLQNCSSCAVLVNQGDVKLLSLQHCTECVLNIVNSHIRYLEMTECELSQVGKMPGEVTMLDLSRNTISRLTPLSCSNLVNLTLSHNSLVSTRGLQYLPNLISLDLSYNNLSTVQNLDKCGLLQHLDLSHNQLVTVPNLKNNVLLSSLDLSANGLTTLEEFSESWLPCLQKLKLVANGLSNLPVLYKICPLLLWLDVSNNMLSDTQEFTSCLMYCQIADVVCDGTELDQDIVKDYVKSTSESALPDANLLQSFLEIRKRLQPNSLYDSLLLEKCEYLVQRQSDAKQLRQHIVTDTLCQLTVSGSKASENVGSITNNNEIGKSHEEVKEQSKGLGGKEEMGANNAGTISADLDYHKDISPENSREAETKSKVPSSNTKITSNNTAKKSHDTSLKLQADSVLRLQSLLRGFKARLRYQNMVDEARQKVYREYQEMVKAALVIQRVWRGYSTRNLLWQWLPWLHRQQEMKTRQHKSAIKIQSVYRGYLLRRRLSEVLSQAVYDLSDCEDLDDIVSVDYDETECERGWGLPPTPSLQHHVPLPPSRSSSIASTQRSVTELSQGPVPLLPLNKLRSRDTTRANSLRSVSDISVLSLPPSRHVTPTKRHVAMAAEWGVSNQETVEKLVQRSKKFGKHVSEKRKRELIRQKILEGSKRTPLTEHPPPPPTAGSAMSSDSVVYQWDDSPLHHHSSRHSNHNSPHVKRSPHEKQALHTQVYRNPKFYDAANNVRLPPLVKKPERPNYSVFR